MIGAHPDDEDTSLLAALSRRYGVQTAYLSLTRGEGGQNLIGPEMWDGLGIIRTGELEAARDLDGGQQFFSRAFDYGFSKRADEALTFWPRDELTADVVWIIRKFRPQVVVSVFTGTPVDGHGQHQAAGIMAREAFEAAGDPERFPEQLARGVEAWAPSKLYGGVWRNPSQATVRVETGAYDPLLGRSELQLAMESRSFHRSQDMGTSRPLGPRTSGMRLEQDRTGGSGGDDGIFAGVDTTLVGAADELPGAAAQTTRAHLEAYRTSIQRAGTLLGGADPFAVVAPLEEAIAHLLQAKDAAGAQAGTELTHVLDDKIALARKAVLAAAGVVLDVRAADDLVTPGQTVRVEAMAWNGGPTTLRDAGAALALPSGWQATKVGDEGLAPDGSLAPASLARWTFDVTLPAGADLSRVYYLRQPRDGYFYRWPQDHPELWGLPRDPAPVRATFSFTAASGGRKVAVEPSVPWVFVGVNPARGEFRRPVLTVPAVSAAVSPGALVWPQARRDARTLTVSVRSEAAGGSSGRVTLSAPAGWKVDPAGYDFSLDAEGAERSFPFEARPTGTIEAGEATFRAVVTAADGHRYDEGFSIIDYEHIQRAALFSPAEATITVIPVRIADGLHVGYILGTGDDGPEALGQMGADVTLLGSEQVRGGNYAPYDVVVVGVRAYETREDLQSANAQLLDYAKGGGTVVVQYNQYDFARGGYAPYEVAMSRPAQRVAEEDAEVKILEPSAPVFTTPNAITQKDFEGWVQERGLYFLSEWDDHFTPLLDMHDQDEPPARGSLLVAPVGDGLYVYAALSFFRQWSSGVPGAYRLFANIVSVKASDWRSFHRVSQPER
jgi:LmbE family N-acetylglucosaminyl deacetylase